MKSPSLDINSIKQQATGLLHTVSHYHIIISFLVVSLFLIYAVLTVNTILNNTTDAEYIAAQQEKSIKTRFDDETITKINDLRSRQENPTLSLPDGRRNPFSEQ